MRIPGFTDTQIVIGCISVIALCAGLGVYAWLAVHGKDIK